MRHPARGVRTYLLPSFPHTQHGPFFNVMGSVQNTSHERQTHGDRPVASFASSIPGILIAI